MTPPRVVVVGGGWAGLSAATALSRAGLGVTVLESARQLGGRARRVPFAGHRVDNGQHLIVGAYRATLELMSTLGVDEVHALRRHPLHLDMRSPAGRRVRLSAPRLPAPAHLLAALAGARGLSAHARWRAIGMCARLALRGFQLDTDISVAELLGRYAQPSALISDLWEPLCVAALNTPIEEASARVFLRVLRDSFTGTRRASDLLFATTDLGALLPDPALEFIEAHGGSVRLAQRVSALTVDKGAVRGVVANGKAIEADHVVLAIPPHACRSLLAPHPALAALAASLHQFRYEPICTVYLQYPQPVSLPVPMLGMLGTTGQWAFDRGLSGQPGLIAVVISSRGAHMARDNATLVAGVANELAMLFPQWPAPRETLVIREKRATFSCQVGMGAWRPGNAMPMPGGWLAGDHTDTGYPATLEGAVRSGLQCARQIIAQTGSHEPS
ncbi:MAG: hydroxysqualene dehydroxylase HpnE [Pseudolabrys sp.]